MSEITDILNGTIDLKRSTAFLVDKVATGLTISLDRQPVESARLEIEVVGATISTGVVSVEGNVNESFNFTFNDVLVGEQNFTSITGITTDGISDGFVIVRAVSKMGQPLNQKVVVEAGMNVRFYAQDGRIRARKDGQVKVAKYKIMAEPDAEIQENDFMFALSGISGMTFGVFSFVEKIFDLDGVTHHTEAELKDL